MFKVKNFFNFPLFLLSANLSIAAYSFLLVIIMSHKYGLSILGYYNLSLAYITPIFCLSYFGFRNQFISDVEYSIDIELALRVKHILTLVCVSFLTVIYYFLNNILNIEIFFLLLFFKIIDSYFDFLIGIYYRSDKEILHPKNVILRYSIFILILIIGYLYIEDFNVVLSAIIISSLLLLLFNDFKNISYIDFSKKKFLNHNSSLFKNGLWITFSAIIGAYVLAVPNYLLVHIHSVKEVGLFAILTTLLSFSNIVYVTIGQYILKKITKLFNSKNNREIWKIYFKTLIFNIIALIIINYLLNLYSLQILEKVFKVTDIQLLSVMPYMSILIIMLGLGQIYSYFIMSFKNYKKILYCNIFSLLVLLVIGYPLINRLSILGAILSVLITGIIQFLFYSVLIYKTLNKNT